LATVIVVWDILTLFSKICTSTYEVCVNLLIWFNIINPGDNISWIFEFFVLCALCCQFHWIVHFWLPLLYFLTSILKRWIWSTCTVALSKQATYYFRWSRFPYYNLTVLPENHPLWRRHPLSATWECMGSSVIRVLWPITSTK
jgi:hypothetical protein